MDASPKGVAAMFPSLGKRNKISQGGRYISTWSHGKYNRPDSIDPCPMSSCDISKNGRGVQTWLRALRKFDPRDELSIDSEYDLERVKIPICDTGTERLLISFDKFPFDIKGTEGKPSHQSLHHLEPGCWEAPEEGKPTHQSLRQPKTGNSALPSNSPLPSHGLLVGRFSVSYLMDGHHTTTQTHADSNFMAVVDPTDAALPLWAVWAYSVIDLEDYEHHYEGLRYADPLFQFLQLPGNLYDTAFDTAFLGRLGVVRDRVYCTSTLFPLKTVRQNVELTRSQQGPCLSYITTTEAIEVVAKGREAKGRRRPRVGLWLRRSL